MRVCYRLGFIFYSCTNSGCGGIPMLLGIFCENVIMNLGGLSEPQWIIIIKGFLKRYEELTFLKVTDIYFKNVDLNIYFNKRLTFCVVELQKLSIFSV